MKQRVDKTIAAIKSKGVTKALLGESMKHGSYSITMMNNDDDEDTLVKSPEDFEAALPQFLIVWQILGTDFEDLPNLFDFFGDYSNREFCEWFEIPFHSEYDGQWVTESVDSITIEFADGDRRKEFDLSAIPEELQKELVLQYLRDMKKNVNRENASEEDLQAIMEELWPPKDSED